MAKCIFHDRIKFTKFNTLLYFLLKRGQASEEKNFLCFLFLLWFILSCNSVILLNSHASELYRGMYQEQIQKHTVSLPYFFIGPLLNKHQTLWKIFSKSWTSTYYEYFINFLGEKHYCLLSIGKSRLQEHCWWSNIFSRMYQYRNSSFLL